MYAEDKKPVALDELDWNIFATLQAQGAGEGPLVKIPFSINTPYLQKTFDLDLIVWNFSDEYAAAAKKVVFYVLQNFDKLFETGWTLFYHYLCAVEPYPDVAGHTLSEFYNDQLDFESPYYSIQLEVNCEHLADGTARYCFVVATVCSRGKWVISDDDARVYMVDNKCCKFETNNDDMQMLDPDIDYVYGDSEDWSETLADGYLKMETAGFQYAKPFGEYGTSSCQGITGLFDINS